MKYLGIDYGTKRIGLAIGDDMTKLALPLTTLTSQSEKDALAAITRIIMEEHIGKAVVGKPTTKEGKFRSITKHAETFCKKLYLHTGIQVVFFDERLTSKAADALIRERSQQGAGRDELAAMDILQNYLDWQLNTGV